MNDILSLAKECGAYELAQQLDLHTFYPVDYDGLYFPDKTLETFAARLREKDLARIAELEEALISVQERNILQAEDSYIDKKCTKALANKGDE